MMPTKTQLIGGLRLRLRLYPAVILTLLLGETHAEDACIKQFKKTVTICSAHEHTVGAKELAIVSHETRTRITSETVNRLKNIEAKCLEAQLQCRTTCSNLVETRLLDGEDVAPTLDRLQDCSEGAPLEHLQQISDKLKQHRSSTISSL